MGDADGYGDLAVAEHLLDEESGPPLFEVRHARLVAEGIISSRPRRTDGWSSAAYPVPVNECDIIISKLVVLL